MLVEAHCTLNQTICQAFSHSIDVFAFLDAEILDNKHKRKAKHFHLAKKSVALKINNRVKQ